MVRGGHTELGFATDALLLVGILVVLVAIAARLYPSVAR